MNCVSFVSHISHLFLATLLLTPWQDRVLVTATIALLAFALLVLLAWASAAWSRNSRNAVLPCSPSNYGLLKSSQAARNFGSIGVLFLLRTSARLCS